MSSRMKVKETVHLMIESIFPKLVFLIGIVFIIIYFFFQSFSTKLSTTLSNCIITKDNIPSIITISSVFIGFFATIMTVLATSQTESMKRLVETKKVKRFILFAQGSLFSSLGIMILSILNVLFGEYQFFIYLYISLLYYFIFSSLRFTYVCIYLFSYSIDSFEKLQQIEKKEMLEKIQIQKENEN